MTNDQSRPVSLPSADEIVQQHAELLQVLSDVRKRNKGGRYNKHDQARILFIKSTALRGLRFGKLMPPSDLKMIRLAPKHELAGADLAGMDAWSKRHAPDPRSTAQGAAADITEEQQTTLLRWVKRHAADFTAPLDARRGRPAAYKLTFGAYKGFTLSALARASAGGGRKSLLPDAPNSTPQPGNYLLWLASRAFTWSFPYHLYLYLALRQLEIDGCTVWRTTSDGAAATLLKQKDFLARVASEMASGERPAYEDMERLDVQPPVPLCMPCFDADAYHMMPIHFWSPGVKFDVEMPCKNHGWVHAEYMHTYPAWSQRRVCGVFSDYTIAGQRLECSECMREHKRLTGLINAATTHNPRSPRIAELKAQCKASRPGTSTLDPTINKLIFEKHPGLAMLMPAVLSHRKAVSPELMMLVSRAARTPQGSHDLEAALREFRTIANAKARLGFYWQQHNFLAQQPAREEGEEVEVEPYTVGVSQVSDTYLAETLLHTYESHEKYMLQWSEQNVALDVVQGDHHGKCFARMSLDGEQLLNWRYTAMNKIGQIAIAVNTETCSYNDAALVEAHRAERAVARREGRPPPIMATCDNPHKDANGIRAALWAGDGKEVLTFPGEIKLVETQAECDWACAYLRRFGKIGFDTESIAYPDGGGTNSPRAAIGQACGDDKIGFIFLFYKWSSCYRSFSVLMSSEQPAKIANNVAHDVRHLQARFPTASRSSPIVINGTSELRSHVAHLQPRKNTLGVLVHEVLHQYLDKVVDHRCWEAPSLSRRQQEYAVNDAWAHLCIAEAAATMPAVDAAMGDGSEEGREEGREEEDGEEEDGEEEEDGGARGRRADACYRHEARQRPVDEAVLDAIADELGEDGEEGAAEEDGADRDGADDGDDAADGLGRRPADPAATSTELLKAARKQIDDYFHSARSGVLELASGFTREQHKLLHVFIDRYGLHHRSVGVEAMRRIVVQRWKPIEVMTAAIGADAIGALVAKEVGRAMGETRPTVVRGRVEGFDRSSSKWALEYADESTETVDINELNVRLARRFEYDHGADGRGEPGAQRPPADAAADVDGTGPDAPPLAAPPLVGVHDEAVMARLFEGISPDWNTTAHRILYDIKHWMGNWAAMVAADKSSLLFKTFMGYTYTAAPSLIPTPHSHC